MYAQYIKCLNIAQLLLENITRNIIDGVSQMCTPMMYTECASSELSEGRADYSSVQFPFEYENLSDL